LEILKMLNEIIDTETATPVPELANELPANVIALQEFIRDFGADLLAAVERDNPPVYSREVVYEQRDAVLQGLLRKPFEAQADAVKALAALLFDQNERAAILNAEMGTGKTMMAISLAAIALMQDMRHILVISPPHLVYKC
jgi:SNF2 family DNA or RNA helicase